MRESLSLGGGVISEQTQTMTPEKLAIAPMAEDYTTCPTEAAFNWPAVLAQVYAEKDLPLHEPVYLVIFRSTIREGADPEILRALDEQAHCEAALSAGFLHYFAGSVDSQGNCLSFCLWRSMEEAKLASGKERHMEAVTAAGQFYESYNLEMRHIQPDGSPAGFAMTEPMRFKLG